MPFRPRRPMRPRAPVVPFLAAGALAIGAALGCAKRPATSQPAPLVRWPAECLIGQGGPTTSDTIVAAFDDTSDARRAQLANTREAPVRFDCMGQPWPGLAVRWSRDTSARFWTLVLKPAATADTDALWTAGALAAAWRDDSAAASTLRYAGVTAVVPLDDQRVVVELARPAMDLPFVFGDRSLGVPGQAPVALAAVSATSADLRDAIDRGVDFLQAHDPTVLDYARRRHELGEAALPWSRAYMLLLPPGAQAKPLIPSDTAALRASLAGDAVSAVAEDARPGSGPSWWRETAECPSRPSLRPAQPTPERIAYRSDDRVAQALAERLVALGASASAGELRARGLAPDSLRAALRLGAARAFVVSVPLNATAPCRELADWPARPTVVPLIDTRARILVRRGVGPLAVERDGAVRPAEASETP
ncbi:MAG TPA: hypothetical protein VFJ50_10635 [Gemmatimonadales bacterium]|nr:hypothetical protein [Gemmatimonadales bacterium]